MTRDECIDALTLRSKTISDEDLEKLIGIIDKEFSWYKCVCIECGKHDGDIADRNFCAGKICAQDCSSVMCSPERDCAYKIPGGEQNG